MSVQDPDFILLIRDTFNRKYSAKSKDLCDLLRVETLSFSYLLSWERGAASTHYRELSSIN